MTHLCEISVISVTYHRVHPTDHSVCWRMEEAWEENRNPGESSNAALPRKDLLLGEESPVTRHRLHISKLYVCLPSETWVYTNV